MNPCSTHRIAAALSVSRLIAGFTPPPKSSNCRVYRPAQPYRRRYRRVDLSQWLRKWSSSEKAQFNDLGSWLPWVPADRSRRSVRRICPVCAEEPDRGILLTATVPLTLSCPEHGCYLEVEAEIAVASATGAGLRRAAPDDVRALDRLTGEGMAKGTVTLPRRSVHVGVWFRMLRTLIDELSISTSRLRRSSADTVYQVWRTLDWPPRAGLRVWRLYERLDAARRQALLHAAARALDLARAGQIIASGTLGHLLTQAPHREVYEGERPGPPRGAREVLRLSWEQATQDIEAWLDAARADPATARQILGILTHFARDSREYDRERDFMIGFGVPAVFLPEPAIGRFGPAAAVR